MPTFPFLRKHIFTLAMAACLLFVILTAAAMLFYPGGTLGNHGTRGYSFFRNFFSELGLTHARNGQPNTLSMVLFIAGLALAGVALIAFFAAFPRFFRGRRAARILGGVGSVFGVVAGVCFIGVAFTPADLYGGAHSSFVSWAFRSFMLAAIFYAVALFLLPGYPRRYALIFAAFAVLLIGYVLLLEFGPSARTPAGSLIQPTGQKIIAYTSIISVLIEAYGASKAA